MNFTYPAFLWALTALLIPIIVHLFNFRRAKNIYFSNVKFLENVKQKSSSKLKLKHLLVLLTRLLFIAALVLTFAQPFIPGKEVGLNSESVTIYLDNSQSTSNRTRSDLTGLDVGISYLEQIVNLYPKQTKFRVITNDFSPASINTKSHDKVLEMSTELVYSDLSRNQRDIYQKVKASISDQPTQDVYWISDFQSSSTNTDNLIIQDSLARYSVIPIRFASHDNLFVDSLYLENPFLISGQVNKLHVRIKNIGNSDANDVILKLFVNNNQAGTASVDVNRNSFTETVLDLNFELQDINECRISFEDFPLTFDNDHYFVLNTLKRISVVELNTNGEKNYVENVFKDNTLFNYSQFSFTSIDYNVLASADLLVLNQPKTLSGNIKGIVSDFLSSNRSVLVIPSPEISMSDMTSLTGISMLKLDQSERIELDRPLITNPFYSGIFEKVDDKSTMPTGKPMAYWGQQGSPLLKFKNGLPFLSKVDNGGTLYLLSSPLVDDYTNFHKHALFVPILYRMAALSSYNYFPLSYPMESPTLSIDMDSIATNSLYKLKKGDQEFIPDQHLSGNKLLIDLPRYLLAPGFYDLLEETSRKNTLAFNTSKSESDPTQMTVNQIQEQFSGVVNFELVDIEEAQTFSAKMKERYEGVQLWKYALILCLIFLLAETLLLRFL